MHAGHPSAEVRGRALESLEFKWKYGLIRAEDLLQVGWWEAASITAHAGLLLTIGGVAVVLLCSTAL